MTKNSIIEKAEATPIFFILGRPRTGSTLLRMLFDAHPNVLIPQEWPMFLLLHMLFGKVQVWDKPTLEKFYKALFQPLRMEHWSIRNWPCVDLELLHRNILSCEGSYPLETLLKVVYLHYNSLYEKKEILLIGDKNPAISPHPDLLTRIFPTARFIHLVRDYRDNLVSLLNVDFEMPNITLLTYRWKHLYCIIEKTAAQCPGRFYTIRYEDFVKQPEINFSRICHFLNLPEDNSIFGFHQKKEVLEATFSPEITRKYFSSLMQPIDGSKVGIYQKLLSRQQIRLADLVAGSTAQTAGYTRDFTSFRLWEYLWTAPAILYTRGLYFLGKIVRVLPYRWMLWLVNKPSLVVKIYSKLSGRKKNG